MSHEKTLLIDADITAYIASLQPTEADVAHNIDSAIKFCRDRTETQKVIMCLSDSRNFRRAYVTESYKSSRGPKPEHYAFAVQHIKENYDVLTAPMLEADDVLGVLATSCPGDYIIVSSDKDLLQIPGQLFNPRKWQDGVVTVTKEAADYYFYLQALTGDAVDGYAGIPGVGPVKAKQILGEPGDKSEVQMWLAVLSAYIKHYRPKITPEREAEKFARDYALTQARLARILRSSEYDLMTDELQLWLPPGSVPKKTEAA